MEKEVTNIYIGHSKALGKKWLVQAKTIEDATGKVISTCKSLLTSLEENNNGKDVEIDLNFNKITDTVVEL